MDVANERGIGTLAMQRIVGLSKAAREKAMALVSGAVAFLFLSFFSYCAFRALDTDSAANLCFGSEDCVYYGSGPSRVGDVFEMPERLDPWGSPYYVLLVSGPGGQEVRSRGPNLVLGDKDDVLISLTPVCRFLRDVPKALAAIALSLLMLASLSVVWPPAAAWGVETARLLVVACVTTGACYLALNFLTGVLVLADSIVGRGVLSARLMASMSYGLLMSLATGIRQAPREPFENKATGLGSDSLGMTTSPRELLT